MMNCRTLYGVFGKIVCNIVLLYIKMKDYIFPPKTKAVLFVAHPDDETLFFYSFIKEHEPYIVVLTNGWSIKRLVQYIRVMKYYGVRYRIYATEPLNRFKDEHQYFDEISKHILQCVAIKDFDIYATHNSEGEYGHKTHVYIHDIVCKNIDNVNVYVPQKESEIERFRNQLSKEKLEDKIFIFKKYYTTEQYVIEQHKNYIANEQLVKEKIRND